MKKNIIIIGCGRVGSGLARFLSQKGHTITVVDNDPDSFDALGENFKGRTVCGIGFDREVLLRAGIDQCDSLAAVTVSDEANVVAARMAKKFFKVPRVAARIYDPRKAEIYRRFGLQTISPVALGISRMAEILTFSQLNAVATIGTGEVDCVELEIIPRLVGRMVSDLTMPGEVNVIAISRGGKTILPTAGTTFEEGDLVHLAVVSSATDKLKKLVEG